VIIIAAILIIIVLNWRIDEVNREVEI